MGTNSIQREMELEGYALQEGIRRYRVQFKNKLHYKRAELAFLRECLHPLLKAIQARRSRLDAQRKRKGRPPKYAELFAHLPVDVLAFIAVRTILETLTQVKDLQPSTEMREQGGEPGGQPLLLLARKIADHCRLQAFFLWIRRAKSKNREGITLSRNPFVLKGQFLRLKNQFERSGQFSDASFLHLGIELVRLAEEIGLVRTSIRAQREGKSHKTTRIVELNEVALSRFFALAPPCYLPMLVKPFRWRDLGSGGYLCWKMDLVKHWGNPFILRYLKKDSLRHVISAVNALQETRWRINRDVFRVMTRIWEKKRAFPGIRAIQRMPRTKGRQFRTKDKQRAYAMARLRTSLQNRKVRVYRRKIIPERLSVAQYLLEEKAIYFPWQIDFRGRAYPIPQVFHPQSDDIGRALIEFADGKRVGRTGAYWLAVHVANMYGHTYDKMPFNERVHWVSQNRAMIIDSATRPLGGKRKWMQAKNPWRFLAACFEWVRYLKQGHNFASHLPVSMDGTCNGLQHLSALIRDPETGEATNVVPSDRPRDIYQVVANRLKSALLDDASRGRPLAKSWLTKGITRKVAKPATMCTPYGASSLTMIRDLFFNEEIEPSWKESCYLVPKLRNCIAATIGRTTEVMRWLKRIARRLADGHLGVRWITPTGLHVVQEERKYRVKRIATPAFGTYVDYDWKSPLGIDRNAQIRKIVPNFVHSLDAAHMMLTINALYQRGIRHLAIVHDSYGVHASNVGDLNKTLRHTFVEIYGANLLKRFWNEQRQRAPHVKLLPPPMLGNLDVSAVHRSPYFFS